MIESRSQPGPNKASTFRSTFIVLIIIFFITILAVIVLSIFNNNHLFFFTKLTPQLQLNNNNHNSPTPHFDRRIKEFLQEKTCEPQFFMTWINSTAEQFSNRQTLALETLFKSHPNACLTILSETLDSPIGRLKLNPLSALGFRILPISPDLRFLFAGTPALAWFDRLQKGEIDTGEIPFAQNLSNLLRLATLYKYGGVYLDTDFIVLRSLAGIRNSIGAQRINSHTRKWSRLNNAVLVFDRGHPLVMAFIREFVAGFDGSKWGHNGPHLVSRVVEKRKSDGLLKDFTVLPPVAFYPVDWIRIYGLFERPKTQAQRVWAQMEVEGLSAGSYGVHLWNKESGGLEIEEGSVIGRLISDRCILCHGIFTPS